MKLAEKPGTARAATQQDATDRRRAERLMTEAIRCRRLAASIGDHAVGDTLRSMAQEYEAEAAACRY